MAGAETGYVPALTQNVVALSEGSLLISTSISSSGVMSLPVQPQVAASVRSSVVATNANRASNGTSRITRFLNTEPLMVESGFSGGLGIEGGQVAVLRLHVESMST